jgi:hypothetical protein
MKLARCRALRRIICDAYYVDRGEEFETTLADAARLGPDSVKILSTRDDDGPPPPRTPSSGTLVAGEKIDRQQKKTQIRDM